MYRASKIYAEKVRVGNLCFWWVDWEDNHPVGSVGRRISFGSRFISAAKAFMRT